jgi:hypothetical protein
MGKSKSWSLAGSSWEVRVTVMLFLLSDSGRSSGPSGHKAAEGSWAKASLPQKVDKTSSQQ